MKKSELAQFIKGIKNLNNGQLFAILNLLDYPLAEPMTSEEVEQTVKRLTK